MKGLAPLGDDRGVLGTCWVPDPGWTGRGRRRGCPTEAHPPRAHAPTFLITEFFVLVEIFYICIIQDRGHWPHVTVEHLNCTLSVLFIHLHRI